MYMYMIFSSNQEWQSVSSFFLHKLRSSYYYTMFYVCQSDDKGSDIHELGVLSVLMN